MADEPQFCPNHPGIPGSGKCSVCDNVYCYDCVKRVKKTVYCIGCNEAGLKSHNEEEAEKKRKRTVLILSIVAGTFVLFCLVTISLGWHEISKVQAIKISRNEGITVAALKQIAAAQSQFFTRDMNGDGIQNYAASLQELGSSGALSDPALSGGMSNGYIFTMGAPGDPDIDTPDWLTGWSCRADPMTEGVSGDRFYYIDQAGTILYRLSGPATAMDDPAD